MSKLKAVTLKGWEPSHIGLYPICEYSLLPNLFSVDTWESRGQENSTIAVVLQDLLLPVKALPSYDDYDSINFEEMEWVIDYNSLFVVLEAFFLTSWSQQRIQYYDSKRNLKPCPHARYHNKWEINLDTMDKTLTITTEDKSCHFAFTFDKLITKKWPSKKEHYESLYPNESNKFKGLSNTGQYYPLNEAYYKELRPIDEFRIAGEWWHELNEGRKYWENEYTQQLLCFSDPKTSWFPFLVQLHNLNLEWHQHLLDSGVLKITNTLHSHWRPPSTPFDLYLERSSYIKRREDLTEEEQTFRNTKIYELTKTMHLDFLRPKLLPFNRSEEELKNIGDEVYECFRKYDPINLREREFILKYILEEYKLTMENLPYGKYGTNQQPSQCLSD